MVENASRFSTLQFGVGWATRSLPTMVSPIANPLKDELQCPTSAMHACRALLTFHRESANRGALPAASDPTDRGLLEPVETVVLLLLINLQ